MLGSCVELFSRSALRRPFAAFRRFLRGRWFPILLVGSFFALVGSSRRLSAVLSALFSAPYSLTHPTILGLVGKVLPPLFETFLVVLVELFPQCVSLFSSSVCCLALALSSGACRNKCFRRSLFILPCSVSVWTPGPFYTLETLLSCGFRFLSSKNRQLGASLCHPHPHQVRRVRASDPSCQGEGTMPSIQYSEKYFDDTYEYRHVVLPPEVAQLLPKDRLLSEAEWRGIGVQQSRGWIHYAIHRPEPHIMLFRRPLNYPQQGAQPTQPQQQQQQGQALQPLGLKA